MSQLCLGFSTPGVQTAAAGEGLSLMPAARLDGCGNKKGSSLALSLGGSSSVCCWGLKHQKCYKSAFAKLKFLFRLIQGTLRSTTFSHSTECLWICDERFDSKCVFYVLMVTPLMEWLCAKKLPDFGVPMRPPPPPRPRLLQENSSFVAHPNSLFPRGNLGVFFKEPLTNGPWY